MRAYLACVGLIVLVGCFTLVVAPDDFLPQNPPSISASWPTIVIDAGHGGIDEGAKCRTVLEKTLTLDIARRVRADLAKRGFQTLMTRSDDRYVPLPARVEVANKIKGPALFVSIHFNQGSEGGISGIETFYASVKAPPAKDWTWVGFFNAPDGIDSGENLAADVQSAVISKTGARNRGIRARDLFVTRATSVPAILIEGGFITNQMESHLIQSDLYANRLAGGIADGVQAWCQAQPKVEPKRILVKAR